MFVSIERNPPTSLLFLTFGFQKKASLKQGRLGFQLSYLDARCDALKGENNESSKYAVIGLKHYDHAQYHLLGALAT